MELEKINKEIQSQLANAQVVQSLLATTFKGLDELNMKKALFEGMARGYTFKDFLVKNIYAVKFGDGYALVTSIDDARKKAMKSGLAGKSEPKYTEDTKGTILTCTVTVKRSAYGVVGEYTATVYFNEYYAGNKNSDGTTKKNKWGDAKPTLWDTKPRTMIAKVAEMHALRSGFPEEMSQMYVEEEMEMESIKKEKKIIEVDAVKVASAKDKLSKCASMDEMKSVWKTLSMEEKLELEVYKDELKTKLK